MPLDGPDVHLKLRYNKGTTTRKKSNALVEVRTQANKSKTKPTTTTTKREKYDCALLIAIYHQKKEKHPRLEDIFRHDPNTNINKKPAKQNLGYPIRARRAGNISMKYSRDMRNLVSRSAF